MSGKDTGRRSRGTTSGWLTLGLIGLGFVSSFRLGAQPTATTRATSPPVSPVLSMDWRHVGNASIDLALAGLASGPIARVWFSPDGSRLTVRTGSGATFETADLETWVP